MLVSKRNEARQGDTMPLPREAPPADESDDSMAPTPSALMSLIPVGEVSVTPVR